MAEKTAIAVITWDDVLAREAIEEAAREIINGQWAEENEMAGQLHGLIVKRLIRILDNFVEDNQLGEVYPDNTSYILEGTPQNIITQRIPDVSFVREENVNRSQKGALTVAPDLAIEILSPTERPGTTAGKIADYLRTGTRQVWVVNPDEHDIAVHTPEGKVKVYTDAVPGGDVLAGFSLNLVDVFRE